MTEPTQPQPVVMVAPLQWTIEGGRAEDGTPVLRFTFTQGAILTQVLMPAETAEALAKGITQVVVRERSGLILPNGHGG